jgi:hypothetical protein
VEAVILNGVQNEGIPAKSRSYNLSLTFICFKSTHPLETSAMKQMICGTNNTYKKRDYEEF